MHHKEIGQFVEILERHLAEEPTSYPVRIQPVTGIQSRRGNNYQYPAGIWLVAIVGNSQIKVAIDSYDQDSNTARVAYYAEGNQGKPSLLLKSQSESLNFDQIDSMLQVLIEVAKGNMCLRTLQAVGAIGDFRIDKDLSSVPNP